MTKRRFIGGFFETALPSAHIKTSLVEHWKLSSNLSKYFINARSALANLVASLKPQKAWLPAYICHSVKDAFFYSNIPVSYYSVGNKLEPNIKELETNCHTGDLVLAVNYFGKAPSEKFYDFVRKRNDLIFIEDSAQAIDTGETSWGDWQLISPRKIVGVADGGCIIQTKSNSMIMPLISSTQCNSEIDRWDHCLLRFEDHEGVYNAQWHFANQQYEQNMSVSNQAMSDLSYKLLKKIDVFEIISKRQKNFTRLYKNLSHIAFLSESTPHFCPFGFPVQVPVKLRTLLSESLIKIGIFPAIHWSELASPRELFPQEHLLSQELLTLPCDQRYNEADMEYIAMNVINILKNAI